jgi:hypothetical protein
MSRGVCALIDFQFNLAVVCFLLLIVDCIHGTIVRGNPWICLPCHRHSLTSDLNMEINIIIFIPACQEFSEVDAFHIDIVLTSMSWIDSSWQKSWFGDRSRDFA